MPQKTGNTIRYHIKNKTDTSYLFQVVKMAKLSKHKITIRRRSYTIPYGYYYSSMHRDGSNPLLCSP